MIESIITVVASGKLRRESHFVKVVQNFSDFVTPAHIRIPATQNRTRPEETKNLRFICLQNEKRKIPYAPVPFLR